jgi:hypothetical protein
MTTTETDSEVLFFLGAGASVGAGVPATIGMVDGFKAKIASHPENSLALDKILGTLKKWKRKQGEEETKIDIELLLETIERLENKDQDILLKFFEISGYSLEGYTDKKPLKDQLKDYIKEVGIVSSRNIRYLEPLLLFMADYKPLNVFSVNYDICVEQFCSTYKKEYTDGFAIKWNPKLFERKATDIALYKLHGSITWYRTDRGDYVMLPIMSHSAKTTLITGESAETLILYPMRKWEYAEPLLELLIELKKKLEKAKFVFVVGYSFRDNHIRSIFWDTARKNKELVIFLISPDAFEIYEDRLKNYEDSGIQHAFSSDFEYGAFDAFAPSELTKRVIQLPYKFEKILPLLKNTYLKALKSGLRQEKGCKDQENKGVSGTPWKSCLAPFIECEYVDKIKQVLEKGAWEQYTKNLVPPYAIRLAFMAFLTSLISNDESYKKLWTNKLNSELAKLFNVDQLRFNISKESIRPLFKCTNEYNFGFEDILSLIKFMQQQCLLKISLVKDEKKSKFDEVKNKLNRIQIYFQQFTGEEQRGQISLSKYLQIRRDKYPNLEEKISAKDKDGQSVIASKTLINTERQELIEILGEPQLTF